MDRNNRYSSSYDNGPNRGSNQHQHQGQQQYSPQQQHQRQPPYMQQGNNFRRDDYGGNGGGGNGGGGGYRRGGGGGGGPMRDQRGGRRHNNERFNDNRPYNKRPNRPNNSFRGGRHDNQDEADQYDSIIPAYDVEDNNRLPAYIESRVAREKPCRTLFVRNVQYTISEGEVRAMFEKFGEVKDVFNLIENRGMIFITFYDVRAAEEAKINMQGVVLSDRKIDVHYSLPKEEEERAKCDRSKNQASASPTQNNATSELSDYELQSYFGRFGDIKAIRVPHFKKSLAHNFSQAERNQQRLVEFYDSRACVEAFDQTYNTEYLGGRWDVAFFWDHPYKDRTNGNHRRERNHERERDESRGNSRRRSDTVRPPRDYDHYNGGGHSRKDDRYASSAAAANPPLPPHTPAAAATSAAPMHQNVDPRLQYIPPMPAPMSNLSASNAVMPDGQRLEQAQKAQQILSMLAQQPQQQQQPAPAQTASLTSPFQPTNLQSTPPPPPAAFVAPVPPTEDQASQVQQLLGLLSQAAQQQQQHQQQQQQIVSPQLAIHPTQPGSVAPIPGMDPATALSQLAAMLQQQQQQQNNQNH
ncbi:hypothetical protein MBANPS3_001907 [Mucor bainieri]